jgi:hypothetical protein
LACGTTGRSHELLIMIIRWTRQTMGGVSDQVGSAARGRKASGGHLGPGSPPPPAALTAGPPPPEDRRTRLLLLLRPGRPASVQGSADRAARLRWPAEESFGLGKAASAWTSARPSSPRRSGTAPTPRLRRPPAQTPHPCRPRPHPAHRPRDPQAARGRTQPAPGTRTCPLDPMVAPSTGTIPLIPQTCTSVAQLRPGQLVPHQATFARLTMRRSRSS